MHSDDWTMHGILGVPKYLVPCLTRFSPDSLKSIFPVNPVDMVGRDRVARCLGKSYVAHVSDVSSSDVGEGQMVAG